MPSRLVELEIARPGVYGVNTSASGDVMPKEYSVKVNNFVFSDEGYIEARHGSRRTHASPVVGTVRQIFVTKDEAGDDLTIFSTATKIYKRVSGVITDITGSVTTPTAGNWKFYNHNNEIFGTQIGHLCIKLGTPSSGTFVDATFVGANAPTQANIIDSMSAFGRVWHLWKDGSGTNLLTYSSILEPENYNTVASTLGDSGFFNLASSYLKGMTKPTSITEFNGNLIVLNERNLTVWENPWDPLGLTASPMGVLETIGGVGCVARDSLQYTQNDLLFLSEQGVTSLSRVVQEKSMPLKRYSDNIRKEMRKLIRGSDLTGVWSCYFEQKGLYLIGSPDISTTYLIDTSTQLPDESYRTLTWSKAITCMEVEPEESLLTSDDSWAAILLSDEASYLSQLKGYRDNDTLSAAGGSTYLLTYESAWSSIVQDYENNLKFPKKLGVVIKGKSTLSFGINLAFDYGDFIDTLTRTATLQLSSPSTYGTATYWDGVTKTKTTYGTYGGVAAIEEKRFMGFGSGRIMKVKLTATVDGESVSMQRVSIKSKVGKQN